MEKGFGHLFFLTFGGRKFLKVSQGIATIWKQAGLPGNFNLNLQRKLIDSKAARVLDKAKMRRLNAHMTHSEAVSLKTYQGRSNEEAIEDHLLIHDLISNNGQKQDRMTYNMIAITGALAAVTIAVALVIIYTG